MTDRYIKYNVQEKEFLIHYIVTQYTNIKTPEIISYDKDKKILITKKVKNDNISYYYGENDNDIDVSLYDKIRAIIRELLNNNICYIDITGYNFIQDDNGDVWILDFEHAYILGRNEKPDKFVSKFLNGYNGWNPSFK